MDVRVTTEVVTMRLTDGRLVDLFPSGNVQVYDHELRHAVEIELPEPTARGEVRIAPVG